MIQTVLLVLGSLSLIIQQFIFPLNTTTQFIIFLTGIVVLGVPHGAADLLVATSNASNNKENFSKTRFLLAYMGRLILFGLVIWLFPIVGSLLFIFFAAYHFGETDLHQFKTNTLLGKLFVIAYGLVILCVILLHHFDEAKPIIELLQLSRNNIIFINWLGVNSYFIMTLLGVLFFIITFVYFLKYNMLESTEKGEFLIRFAIILFILFNMPMLLGFTFYFVVWHSLLSLKNILFYLKTNSAFSIHVTIRQIFIFSLIAIAGIGVVGLSSYMFTSNTAIAGYIFLGLAVLTAPHLQVMHNMYNILRLRKAVHMEQSAINL